MIEIGKLYRVRGTIPVRTDDGYLMAAYAYHPRYNFYDKDTIWNAQPLVENETVVMVVDIPEEKKPLGVHVLLEGRIQYVLRSNLVPL